MNLREKFRPVQDCDTCLTNQNAAKDILCRAHNVFIICSFVKCVNRYAHLFIFTVHLHNKSLCFSYIIALDYPAEIWYL